MRSKVNKLICAITAALFVLAGLCPPWSLELNLQREVHTERSVGWYPIFSQPSVRALKEQSYPDFKEEPDVFFKAKIDTTRLLIEWACILAVGAAAWVLFLPNPSVMLHTTHTRNVRKPETIEQASKVIEPTTQAVPQIIKMEPASVILPEVVEMELRERVMDFITTEFEHATPQARERAKKFVYDRLRLGAQAHYAEHRTMKNFRDADTMWDASLAFKELTGCK